MNIYRKGLHICMLLAALFASVAHAEDIDIFAGTKDVDTGLPNIIFVLDNTSNWSRQSQQWPGGLVQGQSEVRAIKLALQTQLGKLNVGIVEYNTQGNNIENEAGYVRFDLQEYNATSQVAFEAILDKIFVDIEEPEEKRDSANPYGDLPWDFYNYLGGLNHSNSGAGTPDNLADSDGYTTEWSLFESPLLSEESLCGDTYMIFIGNNAQGNIAGDDVTNSNALKAAYVEAGLVAPDALYGDIDTPLPIPEFVVTEEPGPDIEIPGLDLGDSDACWNESELDSCAAAECGDNDPCSCYEQADSHPGCLTTGAASGRTFKWKVGALEETIPTVITTITATGELDPTGGHDYNFDDWAKFLKNVGVPVTIEVEDEDGAPGDTVSISQRIKVTTYVIDVFNAQSNPELSGVWFGAANAGGGRYFQARSEDEIIAAIEATLGDILAVSSSFAAVTMPISAGNSARRANEVYTGMFRPAPGSGPRWYGNLKRYLLARFDGQLDLADKNLHRAINQLTGFARDCAESYWSYDSDAYWVSLGISPDVASECLAAQDAGKEYSDLPDGPFVEKGAVAQVTRLDPDAVGRTLYTVRSGALAEIDAADGSADAVAMGGDAVMDYVQGVAAGVGEVMPASGLRSTVHGDVVHARPFTVRYDDGTVIIYYGANDGPFRAVNASNGQEEWAFIAPEHFPKLERLYNNTPLIEYAGATQDADLDYAPKDYFFDGTAGSVVTYAEPDDPDSEELGALQSAYIYPTMRRGGRMVYGLNVTDREAPSLMWAQGCPNLDDDTGCTTGFTDFGQTWSTPVAVYAKGYPDADSDPTPLLLMGGGFDDCLNADQADYPAGCSSANGTGVYVLDALTGDLVRIFETDAPVITDVAPVDINADGLVDFVYIFDVAGNVYRIRKADLVEDITGLVDVPDTAVEQRDDTDGEEWLIEKIAAIPAPARRFYNSPRAALFQGTIFVAGGSGDRERPLDTNYPYVDDVQNTFYVLADDPHQDYLAEQQAIDDGEVYTRRVVELGGSDMYQVGTDFPDDTTIRDYEGWYWPLEDRGEQVANPAAIGAGKVLFDTFQPGGATNGICEEPLGIGTAYAIDLFNPEIPEEINCAGGGFCLPPVIDGSVEDVPDGCEDGADCWYDPADCPEGEPNCVPEIDCEDEDANCENEYPCIWAGFDVCDLDPDPDPIRGRTFYTEDIDRISN